MDRDRGRMGKQGREIDGKVVKRDGPGRRLRRLVVVVGLGRFSVYSVYSVYSMYSRYVQYV